MKEFYKNFSLHSVRKGFTDEKIIILFYPFSFHFCLLDASRTFWCFHTILRSLQWSFSMVFTSRGRRMCRLESMARALQMVFILLFFSIAFVQKSCVLLWNTLLKGKETKFLGDIIHKSLTCAHTILHHYKTWLGSHTRFKLVAKGGKEVYRVI